MIEKFDLTQKRLGTFLSILNNIRDYLAQEDVQELGLEKVQKEFNDALKEFVSVFRSSARGSKHTKYIVQASEARVNALTGLIKHAALFETFPEQVKASVGEDLTRIFKKYGKTPYTSPTTELTGLIIGLLEELGTPENKRKIEAIGATAWVDALKMENDNFITHIQQRIIEDNALGIGATKLARGYAYEMFRKLVKTINALAFLHGEEKYRPLVEKIRKEIEME